MKFHTEFFNKVRQTVTAGLILISLAASQGASAMENGVTDEQMQNWRNATFGMFVHWGAYAYLAGTWEGERVYGYSEHILRSMEIPLAEYKEKVVSKFNPQDFDVEDWGQIAKSAGMRRSAKTSAK